ncbi:MAG TPA: M28 family peptidase [Candidatus Acidoferrales bacterium]|nr:M28 family peptidase [Candidatus Acidoferrales bacterium]
MANTFYSRLGGEAVNSPENNPGGSAFAIALMLYALVICLTAIRSRPPGPKSADAPAGEFSSARARNVLRQLVGDEVPHPVGSAENAVVRGRIVAQFIRLGYRPRVQAGFACDMYGMCAGVKNVVARLDGRQPGPAVMLSAHYDSVPAGPGASDDGANNAAVIEIARALKASATLRHPVVFLIDDGEEAGLLGAEAFVASDPWAKDVRADVNMEARGTSGPSAMFETGSANAWLMRMYAGSVHHPDATSIFYAVYKLLPNDTDFTVFKHVGYQGFNFAFIGDVAHYHTPLDNFANASASSIQHQGDNALATLRALANSSLQPDSHSEAVFFDLFGWKTIWWPAQWTSGFAALAFALLVFEIAILVRRRQMRLKEFVLGFVSWPLMIVASGAFGWFLYFLLRAVDALPAGWIAHPAPLLVAFWALGFFVVAILGLLFWRAAGFWGLWSGVWIWWVLGALVLALLAPAFSYVFVVPSLAAGLFGLALVFNPREHSSVSAVIAIVPAAVAAAVAIEAIWFLYDALGGIALGAIAVLVALMSTPLAPLAGSVSRRRRWIYPGAAMAAVLIGTAAFLLLPTFSAKSPEALNLEYVQNADSGKSYWMTASNSTRLPRSLIKAGGFSNRRVPAYPWESNGSHAVDAPQLNLASPVLTVQHASSSGGTWHYDVLLRSPRDAQAITLAFPPGSGVESVSMHGATVPKLAPRVLNYTRGWQPYTCLGLTSYGVEMRFTLPNAKPVDLFLFDQSFGLPQRGAFLQRARPATAVPIQNGDTAVVTRHVTLKPE